MTGTESHLMSGEVQLQWRQQRVPGRRWMKMNFFSRHMKRFSPYKCLMCRQLMTRADYKHSWRCASCRREVSELARRQRLMGEKKGYRHERFMGSEPYARCNWCMQPMSYLDCIETGAGLCRDCRDELDDLGRKLRLMGQERRSDEQ